MMPYQNIYLKSGNSILILNQKQKNFTHVTKRLKFQSLFLSTLRFLLPLSFWFSLNRLNSEVSLSMCFFVSFLLIFFLTLNCWVPLGEGIHLTFMFTNRYIFLIHSIDGLRFGLMSPLSRIWSYLASQDSKANWC